MRPLFALMALAALTASLLVSRTALAQAPAISNASPSAVSPGKATDVTFTGSNLADVTSIWSNVAGKVELTPDVKDNGKNKASVTYRFTVPAEASVGVHAVRIATGQGVSNLRLLMVDDLTTVAEDGKNKSIETAQEITPPVAVEGACEAASFDYFKIQGKQGQRLSVEVYARRLGSALDSAVRLLDASGRELAFSDDEPAIRPDSRLSVKLPADGVYFLELRDIRYQGNGLYRYRLRVGDFPLVNAPFPLAVQRGSQSIVKATGPEVDGVPPLVVDVPQEAGPTVSVSAAYPSGGGSAALEVLASDTTEELESEPNDELNDATPIQLPCAVNGRFLKDQDRDYYVFLAKKGQRFLFQGQARRFGSPADLFLRIYNAAGAKVSEAEDAGIEEGGINYTFPADGLYYLMVEDLLRRGGEEFSYRVAAEPYEPGFELALPVDKFDVPQGGVFTAKITATRQGYNGPITLELPAAPEGTQLSGNVIAEKKNDTTIRVTLPPAVKPGELLMLRLVGKAKIGEKEVSVDADSLAVLRKSLQGLLYPPHDLLASVGVGVGPKFPDFFELSLAQPQIEFAQGLAETSFTVNAKRLNKFPEAITLKLEGLPEGFKAEVQPIAKGKNDVAIKLTGPADAALGSHKLKLSGSGTFMDQPLTVTLADVALAVVRPLDVTLQAPAQLNAGEKQKAKITVTRRGGAAAAVAVTLQNLPQGVTAPAKIEVAADKTEVEVELAAAPDAKDVKVENLLAVAKSKVKEKDVTAQSAAATLVVKAAVKPEAAGPVEAPPVEK